LRTNLALSKFSIALAAEPLPTQKDRDSALLKRDYNDCVVSDIEPDDDLTLTTESLRAIHSLLVDNHYI
jgi:hypothetical protein